MRVKVYKLYSYILEMFRRRKKLYTLRILNSTNMCQLAKSFHIIRARLSTHVKKKGVIIRGKNSRPGGRESGRRWFIFPSL